MAISGTFLADFRSFEAAVAKADVSLKSFEGNAGKVGTALDRTTNSFSGVKIVQQASIAAEAVERIGGVSKLTDQELARIGATAAEASAKLKAMGQDVPPGIQKIADASKNARDAAAQATSSTMNWQKSLLSAASALGIAFSANMLKNFVVGIINSASQIDDLSKKIGVSREAVQRWSYAAEQSGQSIETVDKAVSFMNKTLGEGKKSTVEVLKQAGLSFDAIRAMKPEDAFNTIVKSIEGIEDPMGRARLAVELFGRQGQELLPAIADGFAGTAASAKVMSDETIKRLDAAGDAWVKLANTATIYSGEMLSATISVIDGATSSWSNFFKMLAVGLPGGAGLALSAVSGLEPGGAPGGAADPQAEVKRQKAVQDSIAAAKAAALEADALGKATKAGEDYAAVLGRMAAARIPLTAAQIGQIDLWAKEHQSVSDMAKALRVSEVAVSSYIKSNQQFEKDLKTASTATVGLGRDLGIYGEQIKLSDGLTTGMIATLAGFGVQAMRTLPGVKVAIGELPPEIKKAADEIERLKKVAEQSLISLAGAFADLSRVSSGALSEITGNLSTVVSALEHGRKGASDFQDGLSLFKQGDTLAGIAGMATGIMGIVSAAIAAAKAIKAIWGAFDRNKGRDLVEDFAASFGGFDALQDQLAMLGDAGATLWIKLTQGVGRNNPEQAARVIAEVEAALAAQQAAAHAAGVATEAEAQATIETSAEAVKAINELNERLKVNAAAWGEWSKDVTGYLQLLANNIRSLPLPGPGGMSGGGGISGPVPTGPKDGGFLSGGGADAWLGSRPAPDLGPLVTGGLETLGANAFAATVQHITVTVGEEVIARAAVRGAPRELNLIGAGR